MTDAPTDQQPAAEPSEAEQAQPAQQAQQAPVSEELQEARQRAQLETWAAATTAQREAWDVQAPVTLRQRLIYAEQLAKADLLPTRYRDKPANVLLAIEVGDELGLPRMAALRLLNVVSGQPNLGAEGVRAVILGRGHLIWTEQPWCRTHSRSREECEAEQAKGCRFGLVLNSYGLPLEATVSGQRDGEETVHSATFTLDQAARAGLCRLEREGDVVVLIAARSDKNNPLPWETYTEAMLEARATTTLARRLFPDVTGGLAYTDEELASSGAVAAVAAPAARVPVGPAVPMQEAATVPISDASLEDSRVAAESLPDPMADVPTIRRTDRPDDWTPDADLAEAGPEWWQHAGATVRRRSPVQLAADRLALALGEGTPDIPLPPRLEGLQPAVGALVARGADLLGAELEDVVDAEVVPSEEELAANGEAVAAFAGAVADATSGELADSDDDAPAWPVTDDALDLGTDDLTDPDQPEPAVEEPPAEDVTAGLDAEPPAAEAPGEQADLERPPREALWAEVEDLARQRNKTVDQLLARVVIAERTDVDGLSDEALWRYLQAQQAAG